MFIFHLFGSYQTHTPSSSSSPSSSSPAMPPGCCRFTSFTPPPPFVSLFALSRKRQGCSMYRVFSSQRVGLTCFDDSAEEALGQGEVEVGGCCCEACLAIPLGIKRHQPRRTEVSVYSGPRGWRGGGGGGRQVCRSAGSERAIMGVDGTSQDAFGALVLPCLERHRLSIVFMRRASVCVCAGRVAEAGGRRPWPGDTGRL
ncbi:uncharacterized protein LY79DRAFT_322385 [Colletotrichum navitas]|uniref:Uncharacterized protein n=1 Tax=Colletotrichum navitas TaxID=681940 RepID=A0AAD8Q8E8_9PEZI|nr:uncharacterized protein LY79DRAFT_322385 [Colletotrichum navitas]KAK1597931.1 hypothetical protein LY79DRAFT_322385 [Colletotrichum navitas]